jgi:ABC-type glycerol-3-phosphate transport system substrate-binding protein
MFNSAGIPSPPTNWEELLDDVYTLTEKDKWGNIKKSGIAMGTAENINRSTDILTLLMLQGGTRMTNEEHSQATFNQVVRFEQERFSPGKEALRFYTDFSNPAKNIYCWNRQIPYSIDAFYEGKVAMMINYSHSIETIRAKSPYLNFAIAPVPQIKDKELDINYANYWGLTVSKNSENSNEAWKFILYLAQKENVEKYLESTKRPTAKRDLIEWQKGDPDLGIFANQTLSAKSWHQIDNSAIEKIFADMIESIVLEKTSLGRALNEAADKVTILMKK